MGKKHNDWTDNVNGHLELRSSRPDGAHPISLQSTASAADLKRIKEGRRRARADERAIAQWASDGFSSFPGGGGIDETPDSAGLYTQVWNDVNEDQEVEA
jgi:hypothetical protein